MPQPDFFIIGAPKCGTTSLARWLSEHPEIFIPHVKEPHHFCTDLNAHGVSSPSEYVRLFASAPSESKAVGEASTWYLYSRDAVINIERAYAQPRYIVMTRDPVDMAISLYQHNRRSLYEDCAEFEQAWRLEGRRRMGELIPSACPEPAFLYYRNACALGSLLERLLDTVPAERVLHIPLARVRQEPRESYLAALHFLGVTDDGRLDFPVYNQASEGRSHILQRIVRTGARLKRKLGVYRSFGVARMNLRPVDKPKLTPAVQEELRAHFAPEARKLDEQIARLTAAQQALKHGSTI